MELSEAIYNRRSIRRYTDQIVDEGIIDEIIHAGMYAPSAANKQPWHFIVFSDLQTKAAVMDVHPHSSMLSHAQKAILVCLDENLQHDTGYGAVDCAAATQNMLLMAHALGLGACWIGVYPREQRMSALRKIFYLPDHITAFAIVSLGYPLQSKERPDRIIRERIHKEKW